MVSRCGSGAHILSGPSSDPSGGLFPDYSLSAAASRGLLTQSLWEGNTGNREVKPSLGSSESHVQIHSPFPEWCLTMHSGSTVGTCAAVAAVWRSSLSKPTLFPQLFMASQTQFTPAVSRWSPQCSFDSAEPGCAPHEHLFFSAL